MFIFDIAHRLYNSPITIILFGGIMTDKKVHLDAFEQDIEDHFESLGPISNMDAAMAMMKNLAVLHKKRKLSIIRNYTPIKGFYM